MGQRYRAKKEALEKLYQQYARDAAAGESAIKTISILSEEADRQPVHKDAIKGFLEVKKQDLALEHNDIQKSLLILRGRITQCEEFEETDQAERDALYRLESVINSGEKDAA